MPTEPMERESVWPLQDDLLLLKASLLKGDACAGAWQEWKRSRDLARDAGGAGLGLAIVKSICAAHGGKVEVESAEGKGSRFRVELPLATAVTK